MISPTLLYSTMSGLHILVIKSRMDNIGLYFNTFYLLIRQPGIRNVSKILWVPPRGNKLVERKYKLVTPEEHVIPTEYLLTVGGQGLVLLVHGDDVVEGQLDVDLDWLVHIWRGGDVVVEVGIVVN